LGGWGRTVFGSPPEFGRTGRGEDADRNRRRHQDRCADKRREREQQVVGHRHARLIGKHGDEVRGPDAAAAGAARRRYPDQTRAARGVARALEKVDRHETGDEADEAGEQHQA